MRKTKEKTHVTSEILLSELIIPDEIHDLLRWSDWLRAYRATANSSTANWPPQANGNEPAGSHDDVLECCRVHKRWAEAPHAFVVLKAGATATETELRNYARDHLAHFKCPQRI